MSIFTLKNKTSTAFTIDIFFIDRIYFILVIYYYNIDFDNALSLDIR